MTLFITYSLAERERLQYVNTIETCYGVIHTVRREYIFDDVIEMYQRDLEIMREFPLRVKYLEEHATDTGGVARDTYVINVLGECISEDV